MSIYYSTIDNPELEIAESLALSALDLAENEITQEHVPDELRGPAVGGILSFLQMAASKLPTDLLRRISQAKKTNQPIQLKLLAKDFNNLSRPDHFQFLQVLFLERDVSEAPFKNLADQIKFAKYNTIELTISSIPVVGSIVGVYELHSGSSLLNRKPLTGFEKFFTGAGIIAEVVGSGAVKKLGAVVSRPMSLVTLTKLTKHSKKISHSEAVKIAYFTKFLSNHDFAKLQKVVAAIRRNSGISRAEFATKVKELRKSSPDLSLQEARKLVLKELKKFDFRKGSRTEIDGARNALVSKILTLNRAADAIEHIDKVSKGVKKATFFDEIEVLGKGAKKSKPPSADIQLEVASAKLLSEKGIFKEIIRLSSDSTKKIANLEKLELVGFSKKRIAIIIEKLMRKAKSSDFLFDRKSLGDATVLKNRIKNIDSIEEVQKVVNSIDKKARQGNVVVVVNDVTKYSQKEAKIISDQYFRRKIGRATRIIWANTKEGGILLDISKPSHLSVTKLFSNYVLGRSLSQEMGVLKHLIAAEIGNE